MACTHGDCDRLFASRDWRRHAMTAERVRVAQPGLMNSPVRRFRPIIRFRSQLTSDSQTTGRRHLFQMQHGRSIFIAVLSEVWRQRNEHGPAGTRAFHWGRACVKDRSTIRLQSSHQCDPMSFAGLPWHCRVRLKGATWGIRIFALPAGSSLPSATRMHDSVRCSPFHRRTWAPS